MRRRGLFQSEPTHALTVVLVSNPTCKLNISSPLLLFNHVNKFFKLWPITSISIKDKISNINAIRMTPIAKLGALCWFIYFFFICFGTDAQVLEAEEIQAACPRLLAFNNLISANWHFYTTDTQNDTDKLELNGRCGWLQGVFPYIVVHQFVLVSGDLC